MIIERTELKVFRQAVKCSTCKGNLEVIQDFDAEYEYEEGDSVAIVTYNCRCLNCGTVEKLKSKDYPVGVVNEEVKA